MSLLQLSLYINSIRSKYEEEQKRICDLRILSSNININNPNQLKSLADNFIICLENDLDILTDIKASSNRLLEIIRNNQDYMEELEQEITNTVEYINNTLILTKRIYNDYIQKYKTGEFKLCENNYKLLISYILELHDKNKYYLYMLSIIIETINNIDNNNN